MYTISVSFTDQNFDTPLDCAKDFANYLKTGSHDLIYDIQDENTGERFTVDLSEEDEDATLPNND